MANISIVHKMFVDEYFTNGFNATLAYRNIKATANYNTGSKAAHDILKRPEVVDYVNFKREEIAAREDIQLSFIVQELKNIIEETRVSKSNQIRLQALTQLSKIAGFETKKVDITSKGESIAPINWIEEKTYEDKKNK
jgi:hypothetical protein